MARDALRAHRPDRGAATERRATPPHRRRIPLGRAEASLTTDLEHLSSGAGTPGGIVVAVPLGLWLERHRRRSRGHHPPPGHHPDHPLARPPGLLHPLPRSRLVPAVVALWLYSLFPIVRNTYSGSGRRPARRRSRHGPGDDARAGPARDPPPPRRAGDHGRGPDCRRPHRGHRHAGGFHRRRRPGRAHRHGTAAPRHAPILSGAVPAALLALLVDASAGMGGAGAATGWGSCDSGKGFSGSGTEHSGEGFSDWDSPE